MSREEIEKRVLDTVSLKLRIPPASIAKDVTFRNLGLDSVEAFDILFAFEEEFSLSTPQESVLRLSCINELVDLIHGLVTKSK